ncbi:hypothetical protein DL96DRAFT_1579970 [Flagelloscypha sp. PMI_526]|nr:hypothetical protein DL96DRAFT_1579970 [Flagelloscypha sp. PMI_526]
MVDPNVLATLVTYSQAASRSPFVGDQFLSDANEAIGERLNPFEDMVLSLQDTLSWMNSQLEKLREARDALERIKKQPAMSFPTLPLDIARPIFAMAASESVQNARELSLVSKEIQIWADAEQFKLIHIEQDKETRLVRLGQNRLSTRIQRVLRETRILVFRPPYRAGEWINTCFPPFLAACVNLERLYLWRISEPIPIGPEHIPPKLKHLCCQAGAFVDLDTNPARVKDDEYKLLDSQAEYFPAFPMSEEDSESEIGFEIRNPLESTNFRHAAFRTITHLDIDDSYNANGQSWSWDGLQNMTCLTHFYLDARSAGDLTVGARGLAENLPSRIELCIFNLDPYWRRISSVFGQLVRGEIHEKILVASFYEMGEPWDDWVLRVRSLRYPNRVTLPDFLGDAFKEDEDDDMYDPEILRKREELERQLGTASVWERGMELLQLRNRNFRNENAD